MPDVVCRFIPCGLPVRCKGLCNAHYHQHYRGVELFEITPRGMSALDRWWRQVRITPYCWIWIGTTSTHGYGVFGVNGKQRRAHRFGYENLKGSIPDGRYVDHMCHNKSCVNPDHLRLVTPAENNENLKVRSNNSTGFRGVCYDSSVGVYRVRVTKNYVTHSDGPFATLEEAVAGVTELRNRLYSHNIQDRLRMASHDCTYE